MKIRVRPETWIIFGFMIFVLALMTLMALSGADIWNGEGV